MRSNIRRMFAGAALAWAGCGLHAQSGMTLLGMNIEAVKFAVQGTAGLPMDEFPKVGHSLATPGLGLGAQVQASLGNGFALVQRLDVSRLKQRGGQTTVQLVQCGGECHYYLSRVVDDGMYLGLGAGVAMAKFKDAPDGVALRNTPQTLYAVGALGYDFRSWLGMDVRYNIAKYKTGIFDEKNDTVSPILSTSLIFRF